MFLRIAVGIGTLAAILALVWAAMAVGRPVPGQTPAPTPTPNSSAVAR